MDTVSGAAPSATLNTDIEQVQAQVNGSQADVDLGKYGQVFGTFSGGRLRLNLPQQNGTLQSLEFRQATTSAFNAAVAAIQGGLTSSNSSAAQAQQAQRQQAAIDKAARAVEGNIESLGSDESEITRALQQLPGALAQEKTDLGKVAADEANVINEAHSGTSQGQVCSDSEGVASDAEGVNSDGEGVSSDGEGVVSSIHSTRSDINAVEQDLQALQQAQLAQPTYQDGAPTAHDVSQAVGGAQSAITTAVNSTNEAIGTANQYETQAYQDAQGAAASGSCAAPAKPTLQPTISASS